MTTQFPELKPETHSGLEAIERSMPYLLEKEIITGERTTRQVLDGFYGLGETPFEEGKRELSAPSDLIRVLDRIGDTQIQSNLDHTKYERVKESLEDPETPKGEDLRLATYFGSALMAFGALPLIPLTKNLLGASTTESIICALSMGIAGILSSCICLDKSNKAWNKSCKLHQERTGEYKKAYTELRQRAEQTDKFVKLYRTLYIKNSKGEEK